VLRAGAVASIVASQLAAHTATSPRGATPVQNHVGVRASREEFGGEKGHWEVGGAVAVAIAEDGVEVGCGACGCGAVPREGRYDGGESGLRVQEDILGNFAASFLVTVLSFVF